MRKDVAAGDSFYWSEFLSADKTTLVKVESAGGSTDVQIDVELGQPPEPDYTVSSSPNLGIDQPPDYAVDVYDSISTSTGSS